MEIMETLYTFGLYPVIILLSFVISFIIRIIYPTKSDLFRIIISLLISLIFLFGMLKIYLIVYPLDLDSPEVKISTIDYANPKVKELTYNVDIHNRANKDVDIIITFTRIDSDLYPYINLIPETYTSDKITIKANENKEFISSFTIDSEDARLINSYYLKMKVKYIKQ